MQANSIMLCPRREHVQAVIGAALQAADPREAVHRALRLVGSTLEAGEQRIDLAGVERIFLVGAGKAVENMAIGVADVLGERICGGVLISKYAPAHGDLPMPAVVERLTGGHPIPNEDSLRATRQLTNLLQSCGAEDLVLCVISGGGSALLTLPQPDISLQAIQDLTRLLLASGASIEEINCLRKHLDQVKGGGLARIAHPARLITLVLSDVVGAPLSTIASGPTVPDTTSYADALAVVDRYGLREAIPGTVRWALEEGQLGFRPETVKPGETLFARTHTMIVGSNERSARAALEQARALGFNTLLLTTYLEGEARYAGQVLGGVLRQAATSSDPLPRPACIVAGGETTVALRGEGYGGRNLEVALGAVEALDGVENALLVTLATDGEDGPTDAAGAVVSGQTLARARELGLHPAAYLRENNAYRFFAALKDVLLTGPTGTNVNDLVFLFTW